MKCPDCGSDLILRETSKIKTKDGKNRKFYGCTKWPVCSGTHGADLEGNPLGIPADRKTRLLRIKAHELLNVKYGHLKMKHQYGKVSWIMKLSGEDAHIAKFNSAQCLALIDKLSRIHRKQTGRKK